MARRVEVLHADALFYDVLSGRFFPPSDPSGESHTLGRLMVGSFQNGEASKPIDSELDFLQRYGHIYARRFRPPWAPTVESTALYREDDSRRIFKFAAGIVLRTESGAQLAIAYHPIDGSVTIEGTAALIIPELGSGLTPAQEEVAEHAQQFFAAAHALSKP